MERVCELCLTRKATDKHHIIPRIASVPDFDIDRDDNIVYICSVCHRRLTPTSALISYSLRKEQWKQSNNVHMFVKETLERIGDEMPASLTAGEVVDIMLETMENYV